MDNQLEVPFNLKITLESSDDTIWDVGGLIKQALLGMGYHSESVSDLFNEENNNDKNKDTE